MRTCITLGGVTNLTANLHRAIHRSPCGTQHDKQRNMDARERSVLRQAAAVANRAPSSGDRNRKSVDVVGYKIHCAPTVMSRGTLYRETV